MTYGGGQWHGNAVQLLLIPMSSMAMPWECQKVFIDDSLAVAFVLKKVVTVPEYSSTEMDTKKLHRSDESETLVTNPPSPRV